ncbi:hypothetical protein EB815_14855 [Mesorhizobium loti]|jgi:hypothetical protein|uniref:Uncharacterized protein n=1 Tax=Rhizobium loti TaxID=381 RepID=A0A6M7TZD2_RHILI|nr:hypothetical protein ASE05_10970 [Mesorhizobium sp. Root172]OBQ63225.1 hypothetical protein A8145_19080 [Mesorhizobium loti]QKC70275.1 hypothetical protein EB815_14855 [Mesorhizobium loti]
MQLRLAGRRNQFDRGDFDMTFHPTTRRAVLGTVVSIPTIGAPAVEWPSAANLNESPILAGFRRWEALRESICFDICDNDLDRLYADMADIVETMLATPAKTIPEFAAQFMVVFSGDEIAYPQAARDLHAHSQTLVGMAQRARAGSILGGD